MISIGAYTTTLTNTHTHRPPLTLYITAYTKRPWVTYKSLILPGREKKALTGSQQVGRQVVFALTDQTTLCASRPFHFSIGEAADYRNSKVIVEDNNADENEKKNAFTALWILGKE